MMRTSVYVCVCVSLHCTSLSDCVCQWPVLLHVGAVTASVSCLTDGTFLSQIMFSVAGSREETVSWSQTTAGSEG